MIGGNSEPAYSFSVTHHLNIRHAVNIRSTILISGWETADDIVHPGAALRNLLSRSSIHGYHRAHDFQHGFFGSCAVLVYHLCGNAISGLYFRAGKKILDQLVAGVDKVTAERLFNYLEVFQKYSLCEYVLDIEN